MTRIYATGAFFGIILILAGLAAVAMLGYVVYYYVLAGLLAPTRRVMARVSFKQQRERGSGGSSYFSDDYGDVFAGRDDDLSYDFFIVFEVGGKSLDFCVPMSVYADVEQGDTGLLVHKGNLFRQFIRGAGGWTDPVRAPITPVKQ